MTATRFPADFVFGSATSAQQIEGAVREGGRGESIWDRMGGTPGRIAGGATADVACDHFHRWREDIERMKWLGLRGYRFSIAWPRILPEGTGVVNRAGLDFYDSLVDGLLEAGIQPHATLYHWDLPQALQDRGGWGARFILEAFAEYTDVVSQRLGDRVGSWSTHNEPWCVATLGHEAEHHAPAHREPAEALRVAHHLLVSHGMAVKILRENAPGAEVGIVLNLVPATPNSDSEEDLEALRRFDGFFNRWYLDPLYRGHYPEDAIADRVRSGHLESAALPFVEDGDMELAAVPTDFLGVNYYSRLVVQAGPDGNASGVRMVPEEELDQMGWEDYPDGLYQILDRVHRDYSPARLYITENGTALDNGPDATGRIADTRRVDYLSGHLEACARAVQDGIPLAGYFAWSLMDNFEWAHGYARRFGLYWVDFETQQRLPKDSAFYYRDFLAAHAAGVDGPEPSPSPRRGSPGLVPGPGSG